MKDSFSLSAGGVRVEYKRILRQLPSSSFNRCSDGYEILYVIDGCGKLVVEGAEYNLNPNSLILLRPLEYYTVLLNSESDFEGYAVSFSKSFLFGSSLVMLEELTKDKESGGVFYAPHSVPMSVLSTLDRFESSEALPEREKAAYMQTLVMQLVIFLSAAKGENISHIDTELASQVIRHINYNIKRNLSLDKIAGYFFVSKYHLCRAFKKHNGISIHDYIIRKRVTLAKQLIDSGETASDAAYKVGFGDYSSFYRAYVKVLGNSPSQRKDRAE